MIRTSIDAGLVPDLGAPYMPNGPFRFYSASGQWIELEAMPQAPDSADALFRITLLVQNVGALAPKLGSAGIATSNSSTHAMTLEGTRPACVEFIDSANESGFVPSAVPSARAKRISWIVLTASDSVERRMRQTFDVLGLTKKHEGCCDYWLLGPVGCRTAIRFSLPDVPRPPNADWLTIEEGGIIYSY